MITCKILSFKRRNHLGAKFKNIRIEKGYTIEFVSHHACIEPRTLIYEFEEGHINLPLEHLYAIANILEISPRELLAWIDENK